MKINQAPDQQLDTHINPIIHWLIPPGLLTLLTILTYYPSLHYPFQFDDIANIARKFSIRFDQPFLRWWGSCRWVGEWLNSINYKIGGFDPFSYRTINLSLHILAGLTLFYLILTLLKNSPGKPFLYNNRLYIAFVSGALFLLHPVQTQTVSYVIQARLEGLAALFILLTILLYSQAAIASSRTKKIMFYTLFYISGFLCCGTKELVVVLPFLLLITDWFFIAQQKWENFKHRLLIAAIFFLIIGAIMIHHLGDQFVRDVLSLKASTGNNRGNILTPGAFDIIFPSHYFMSQFKVILHYLWIFLWPFNISVEYDWKLASSFWSFQVIAPLIILLMLAGIVVKNIIQKNNPIFTFGILWFMIAIAPRSSIIPCPELVCDYKTYLASAGMMLMLGTLIIRIITLIGEQLHDTPAFLRTSHIATVLLAIMMIPVAYKASSRNEIWETPVKFWQDCALQAPNKARVHNNLGVALSEVGRIDEAIVAYNKAIELDRVYSDPLSNLAVAYSLKGDNDKAIDSLKMAIHIAPNYAEAYNNLGTLLLQQKDYEQAERVLNVAIQLRPYYGKAYYNLARLFEEKKDSLRSWEYLKKATEGDFDSAEIIYKLGQMSLKVQKFPEAIEAFERVIELGAGNQEANVWFNLGNAYFLNNDFEHARVIYERLVRDNPLDGRFIYNLAETLYTQKYFDKALEAFKQAVSLPKSYPQSHLRLVNCLEALNRYPDALNYLNDLAALPDIPQEFSKVVHDELTRVEIQSKINAGNGSIRLEDLKQAVGGFEAIDGTTTATTRVINIQLPQQV